MQITSCCCCFCCYCYILGTTSVVLKPFIQSPLSFILRETSEKNPKLNNFLTDFIGLSEHVQNQIIGTKCKLSGTHG